MRALLVDDEALARRRLRGLLAAHPEVEIVAEADSVASAETAIRSHAPDLIFLDISMPGGTGFDLLRRARPVGQVVFVTAHDEHAVRAFDVGAVDYLLKPIEPGRLAETLQRLHARPAAAPDRIVITHRGVLRVVPVADVSLVRADGDYSRLLLRDGTEVAEKQTLAEWERRLGAGFLRVHRGALVALAEVDRVEPAEGSTFRVHLRGHSEAVTVSRARVAALKSALLAR